MIKKAELHDVILTCVYGMRKQAQEAQEVPVRPGTHAIGNDRLEGLGKYTSALTLASLGSGLGYIADGDEGGARGALMGAGAGVAANIIARIVAAIRKSRTGEEQQGYDNSFRLSNLFVPGAAAYNESKRDEREKIHTWH